MECHAAEHYTRISRSQSQHTHPDCGCALIRNDDGSVSFHQCPTHAAAPDLLAFVQRWLPLIEGEGDGHEGALPEWLDSFAPEARALIASATGK